MKTKPVNQVDRVFRAVADPTRLRILNMLRSGERCVCEIVDVLRCPQPKASRHLAYLRRSWISERAETRAVGILQANAGPQCIPC